MTNLHGAHRASYFLLCPLFPSRKGREITGVIGKLLKIPVFRRLGGFFHIFSGLVKATAPELRLPGTTAHPQPRCGGGAQLPQPREARQPPEHAGPGEPTRSGDLPPAGDTSDTRSSDPIRVPSTAAAGRCPRSKTRSSPPPRRTCPKPVKDRRPGQG